MDHSPHIRRHFQELVDEATDQEVDTFRSTLGFDPAEDLPLDSDHCNAYLLALRDVRGELAYRMARLNFFLAGCPTARDNPDSFDGPGTRSAHA